jgi:hypothetical protein
MCILRQILHEQTKENEMGRECRTHERHEKFYETLSDVQKESATCGLLGRHRHGCDDCIKISLNEL